MLSRERTEVKDHKLITLRPEKTTDCLELKFILDHCTWDERLLHASMIHKTSSQESEQKFKKHKLITLRTENHRPFRIKIHSWTLYVNPSLSRERTEAKKHKLITLRTEKTTDRLELKFILEHCTFNPSQTYNSFSLLRKIRTRPLPEAVGKSQQHMCKLQAAAGPRKTHRRTLGGP